jgi:hypothetical protein
MEATGSSKNSVTTHKPAQSQTRRPESNIHSREKRKSHTDPMYKNVPDISVVLK